MKTINQSICFDHFHQNYPMVSVNTGKMFFGWVKKFANKKTPFVIMAIKSSRFAKNFRGMSLNSAFMTLR